MYGKSFCFVVVVCSTLSACGGGSGNSGADVAFSVNRTLIDNGYYNSGYTKYNAAGEVIASRLGSIDYDTNTISYVDALVDGQPVRTTHRYNDQGDLVSAEGFAEDGTLGNTVLYDSDENGRLLGWSMSGSTTSTTVLDYNDAGQLVTRTTEISMPDEETIVYNFSYDASGRLNTKIVDNLASPSPADRTTFGYNSLGLINVISKDIDSNGDLDKYERLTYDEANNLVGVSIFDEAGALDERFEFSYEPADEPLFNRYMRKLLYAP